MLGSAEHPLVTVESRMSSDELREAFEELLKAVFSETAQLRAANHDLTIRLEEARGRFDHQRPYQHRMVEKQCAKCLAVKLMPAKCHYCAECAPNVRSANARRRYETQVKSGS